MYRNKILFALAGGACLAAPALGITVAVVAGVAYAAAMVCITWSSATKWGQP